MRKSVLLLGVLVSAAACAPSPLFVGSRQYTPGAVPHDQFGRPVLDAIEPTPPQPDRLYDPSPEGAVRDLPPVKPLPSAPDYPGR